MPPAVFAFLCLTSGSYEGAVIRDTRLANELNRRGFKVFIYWLVEKNPELVDPGITQRELGRGARFLTTRPNRFAEALSLVFRLIPAARRRALLQRRPATAERVLSNLVGVLCDGPTGDPALTRRLAKFLGRDGVTHLLPGFAMTCPLALGAKQVGGHHADYLVTFIGDEMFANIAERIGRRPDFYRRLREAAAGSPWPAAALSEDHRQRVAVEVGMDAAAMRTIYPGIEMPPAGSRPPFALVTAAFPRLNPDVPIVTFIGRQEAEKGIDLLLYAAKMLDERGVKMQLVIAGGTSFGTRYFETVRHIVEHLEVDVHHYGRVPDATRDALYAHSRCVVYPSIRREPFGMVGAEAMSHGTPVVVPGETGIAESVSRNGLEGGLTFRIWDSGDLAHQLERMLTDDELHGRLAANAREVADNFSVVHMTDALLDLVGVAPTPIS